ncbi:MAG: RtcB family protein [Calditrichia bacterium]
MDTMQLPKTTAKIVNYHNGAGVPVHFYLDDNLMPDERALQPLETLSAVPEVNEYLVALPDLHYKSRNIVPTGLVTVSKNHIIPFAVDKGINCGMRIISLPFSAEDFPQSKMDAFYEKVMARVPAKKHEKSVLKNEEVIAALLNGAEWALRYFGLPEEDLLNYEKRGNLFRENPATPDDIEWAIPKSVLKKGRRGFGVLGGGNHFLEIQKIIDVLNPQIAEKLGLAKDQLVLMLHTGTGGMCGSTMRFFNQVFKEDDEDKLAEKEQEKAELHDFEPADPYRQKWFEAPHLYGIPADSPSARHFLTAVSAVANFGFVNRTAITYHIQESLREVFGDKQMRAKLMFDSSHVTVQQEDHVNGRFWVHRNGANWAAPASYMSDHPLYSQTGQPIPVPGSMGSDSYIAVASEGAHHTFCSTNHGAGRLLDKPEAGTTFGEAQVLEQMQSRGIRLYRYGNSDVTEQAPGAFKNIDNVLNVMEQFDIAKGVVKVRPLATLKG